MVKVLIVEDSMVKSQYLEYILSNDEEIEVIGSVANGKLAIDFIKKNKPDIITMDIEMPVMNGIEATKRIMATTPVPIIIVTARKECYNISTTMDALAFGAVSVVDQPYGFGHPDEKSAADKLVSLVKVLSKVKVVTRKPSAMPGRSSQLYDGDTINLSSKNLPPMSKFLNKKIIAIGVSSGGPQVLAKIFSRITEDFPYPILVVQHITEGFLANMVNWLGSIVNIPVHVAKDNEAFKAGNIYFAPDNYQMGVSFNRIKLMKCENQSRICPSVDYLFSNLAMNYGKDIIGFVLTGMGSDGAMGVNTLRTKGAVTIAQDKESSLVFGMPSEAIKMGGIDYALNTEQISDLLVNIEKKVNSFK